MELFLSHIEARCGVRSASEWWLTDPGSFLHAARPSARGSHTWPGVVLTPAACKGKSTELHVEILQGPHHVSSARVCWRKLGDCSELKRDRAISSECTWGPERGGITQQALALGIGEIGLLLGLEWAWAIYTVRAQLSRQLYFDYLSCSLPDYEIEDNNTHLKKWFRYKRQAWHIIYSNKALINLPSLLVWTEHMFQAS